MEFDITADQKMMQESIDRTLERVCPLDRVRKANGRADDVRQALAELGVTGILIPEEFGGHGLTLLDAALAAEMLGKHVAPVPFVASAVMAPLALIGAGTDAQKKTWLPKFASGEIIAGVIYQPISDELFWAEKGNGAFIDTPNARSRRLRVSGRKDPARALVATGIPHIGKGGHAAYFAKLAAVTERTAGIRRWGAGALDLAFVAAGRYDAFFEFGLQPWDVAAGLLLVREAGGVIGDISGKPYELGGPSLLASNFGLRDSMVEILSKA